MSTSLSNELLLMRRGGQTYTQKILAKLPFLYYIFGESSGTTADNAEGTAARDGTYNSDVSGWPPATGIGDGNTAPTFSGDDFIDGYSTSFRDAFNGQEFCILLWVQVSSAQWTDGTRREFLRFIDTTTNIDYVWIAKDSTNNQWWVRYSANNTVEDIRVASGAPTTFQCLAVRVSLAGDSVRVYVNGVQIGAEQTGLGTWGGTLKSDGVTIGKSNTGNNHIGKLAHVAVFPLLSEADLISLMTL